jgi:hypothetical protein
VPAVGGQGALGQVGTAQPVEVHGQEGDIRQRVPPAQPVLELDAVEHPGTVIEQEDVVRQQVAVPVERPALGDPALEQQAPAGQVAGRQSVDLQHLVQIHHAAPVLEQTRRVVRPAARQSVAARCHRRHGRTLGPGMERGDEMGEVPQLVVDVGAAQHQGRKPALVGHAPHHD